MESEGKRGSRWVSHLVDGEKAREMKRRGRVRWRERELEGCVCMRGFMGNICVRVNRVGMSVLCVCVGLFVCAAGLDS